MVFSLFQQFDIIFVEELGDLMCFVCGVVEHPKLDSYVDDMLSASAEGSLHVVFSRADLWFSELLWFMIKLVY